MAALLFPLWQIDAQEYHAVCAYLRVTPEARPLRVSFPVSGRSAIPVPATHWFCPLSGHAATHPI